MVTHTPGRPVATRRVTAGLLMARVRFAAGAVLAAACGIATLAVMGKRDSSIRIAAERQTEASATMVAEMYAGLRNSLLTTKAEAIGLKPAANEVWGVMMETGYSKAVASLVAVADGTVSLHFSNGGGIIGLGQHPGPRRIGKEFIALAQQFAAQAKPTTDFPLPQLDFTSFCLLSGSGVLFVEANANDLGQGRHPLSRLFLKGHELITEIRVIDEKRSAGPGTPAPSSK